MSGQHSTRSRNAISRANSAAAASSNIRSVLRTGRYWTAPRCRMETEHERTAYPRTSFFLWPSVGLRSIPDRSRWRDRPEGDRRDDPIPTASKGLLGRMPSNRHRERDVRVTIRQGDCREVLLTLLDESVHSCITSPPYYGLRDYGIAGQIGLEKSTDAFVAELVGVFREVRRILRKDGTLWLNLGDTYEGKSLLGIPWRVALALQADGWRLRQDIIWSKPNPMPESVKSRCTKSHEYIFLFSKSDTYYFDHSSIRESASDNSHGGAVTNAGPKTQAIRGDAGRLGIPARDLDGKRSKRSVWNVANQPFRGAHCAVFPPALIEPCIIAGTPIGGTVLDPFGGSGTTALVAGKNGRDCILIEINPTYAEMAKNRTDIDYGLFAAIAPQS